MFNVKKEYNFCLFQPLDAIRLLRVSWFKNSGVLDQLQHLPLTWRKKRKITLS